MCEIDEEVQRELLTIFEKSEIYAFYKFLNVPSSLYRRQQPKNWSHLFQKTTKTTIPTTQRNSSASLEMFYLGSSQNQMLHRFFSC